MNERHDCHCAIPAPYEDKQDIKAKEVIEESLHAALMDKARVNEYVKRLQECETIENRFGSIDVEAAHKTADQVLLDALVELGCEEIACAWLVVPKWFA